MTDPDPPLWYCVVQEYDGTWKVCSYGCRTKAAERRVALMTGKQCILVTRDHDEAQRIAAQQRKVATT